MPIDLALVTDGLKAEREQGITIDVAYRYFATAKRRFIIADTPGHVQYTRNMATGASTADLAVILIDARLGVQTQSKRHAFIASLLGVPRVVVAVNKMDLVGYRTGGVRAHPRRVRRVRRAARLRRPRRSFRSARSGATMSSCTASAMPWFDGVPLLPHLETVYVGRRPQSDRFPLSGAARRAARPGLSRLRGQIVSGVARPGDEVVVLPSGQRSRITRIVDLRTAISRRRFRRSR